MSAAPGIDRFRGAFLGLAAADALAERHRQEAGRDPSAPAPAASRAGAGRWSATTQAGLCVARALLEASAVDPRVVAAHLRRWAETGDWRHAAPALRRVLIRLRRGGPWDACAAGGSRGAGGEAVGAAVPIGSWLWDQPDARRRAVRMVLRISRRRSEPADAACVAADAVAWAMGGGNRLPPLAETASAVRSRFLRKRLRVLERARAGEAWAIDRQVRLLRATPAASQIVLAGLEASDWGARAFNEAVERALVLGPAGGEAAALAGALVGARQGEGAVPEALRRGLEQVHAIAGLAESIGHRAGAARRGLIPVAQTAARAVALRVWRLTRITVGAMLVLLGIAGLFLPFLQGILFLVSGLAILGAEFRWARDLMRRLRVLLKRLPRALRATRRL